MNERADRPSASDAARLRDEAEAAARSKHPSNQPMDPGSDASELERLLADSIALAELRKSAPIKCLGQCCNGKVTWLNAEQYLRHQLEQR